MPEHDKMMIDRRGILKTSAAVLGSALLGADAETSAEAQIQQNVNTHSSPSTLKITDLRYAVVVKPGPSPCPVIRIDTNQGVYGLGELRDGAGPDYALMLKSRILAHRQHPRTIPISE